MAITSRTFQEFVAIGLVSFRAVEFAWQTLASDPVALDVAHMGMGSLAGLATEPHKARLHNRAASTKAA
ncbi:hypothetical protein SKA58_16608 [Sphingomonas sp. SKA58]|nr:hypothetical protein SKA58_16608 [Sphingomonas sp. SKA58]